MYKNFLLKQIDLFIAYLKKLDDKDFVDLENGNAKISFVIQRNQATDAAFDTSYFERFAKELSSMATREECDVYFERHNFQKKDLEGILKYLGVSLNKKDTKCKMQSKIIENTIGKKLRDEAIINK